MTFSNYDRPPLLGGVGDSNPCQYYLGQILNNGQKYIFGEVYRLMSFMAFPHNRHHFEDFKW